LEKPVNEFQFGRQAVHTKVNIMTATEVKALPFDVADFLPWEGDGFDPLALTRAGAPDAAGAAVWDEEVLSSQCSVPSSCERGNWPRSGRSAAASAAALSGSDSRR